MSIKRILSISAIFAFCLVSILIDALDKLQFIDSLTTKQKAIVIFVFYSFAVLSLFSLVSSSKKFL